ncbi:hypothetical protein AAFC00_003506 [Neodothiora populina]|uniref:Ion transport domain-containing protein n=1 Tax=Neodothiora populina TaxID=2781224 RepID=A0ABR3PEK4_9PEZI
MFSSLWRPKNRGRRSGDRSPSPVAVRRPLLENGDRRAVGYQQEEEQDREDDMDYDDEEDEGEDEEIDTPLLPIFSSEHLDQLPLYNITHSCRILIVQKVETTLSWDQLRSPQISQFVVKPIQSTILADHFNRATICALIANCLQFQKEAQTNPGNAGVSKTRAMVSELLAMRLLKEFSIRELIDALSYDFDPLEGITTLGAPGAKARQHGRGARISTVEIAIRSQAKRFLAHPLVVQQLEAIWAGTIVFHSAADSLHRRPAKSYVRGRRGYGAIENGQQISNETSTVTRPIKSPEAAKSGGFRRSVTLYNPKDASLFKLSRLRVPRYRQIFSTLSFAIMLGLFLAVLADRSLEITPLEVVFWFWSAGYMLDEVVGFSEQGFGLYIMSVWNAFDLGILLLFFIYYFLRLYGVLIAEDRRHTMANMAYDVLASSAILLFPRLFSVLDHYRYFSQLLIAFRMMAQDMVAILILIVISCSGFFVAFTLSFSDSKTDGSKVAYALFQLVMGFTPAAWEMWPTYNVLGRSILTIFLFICHFLIVTILITVLTNSFMAIVQNANEEHQFLFAVNTISMVKSDALFSYIPPTNLFGWVATPFRWMMPFRTFVKGNRTIIKVTHFPILFSICVYERMLLARNAYEPTDLVERKSRARGRLPAFAFNRANGPFSPGTRLREPSIVSFHKERALDEVFRRPYQDASVRTPNPVPEDDRRRSTNVVGSWMRGVSIEGGASPPLEQPRSVVERLENRARPGYRRAQTSKSLRREHSTATRSVASEPEDISTIMHRPTRIEEETEFELSRDDLPQETDADGDDELLTNDDGEGDNMTVTGYEPVSTPGGPPDTRHGAEDVDDEDDEDEDEESDKENHPMTKHQPGSDYFGGAAIPQIPGYGSISHATKARIVDADPRRNAHERHASSQTILFSPVFDAKRTVSGPTSSTTSDQEPRRSRPQTTRNSGTSTPIPLPASMQPASRKIPKPAPATRSRPNLAGRSVPQTSPNLRFDMHNDLLNHRQRMGRAPSFNAIALDLASDLGDNRYGPDPMSPGLPASFSEQLRRERDFDREMERRHEQKRRQQEEEEKGMVGRIMLARMNTLEEGFREVLREVKDLASVAGANSSRGGSEIGIGNRHKPGTGGQLPLGGKGVKLGGRSPKKLAVGSKKGKERMREDDGADDRDAVTAEDVRIAAVEEEETLSPQTVSTLADLGIPTNNDDTKVSYDH